MKRLLIPTRLRLDLLRLSSVETKTAAAPPPHVPVLCDTAIDYLQPVPGGTYFDMTFGAGGHTRRLLEKCPEAKVYALDRDPVAHQLAREMSESEEYKGSLIPLLGKFSDLPRLFKEHGLTKNSTPERRMSSRQPHGVQGRKPPRSPMARRPSFTVCRPSTSFSGETASVIRCESMEVSQSRGICTMIPCTFGSSFRSLICKGI